jgi:hypothetical protein
MRDEFLRDPSFSEINDVVLAPWDAARVDLSGGIQVNLSIGDG